MLERVSYHNSIPQYRNLHKIYKKSKKINKFNLILFKVFTLKRKLRMMLQVLARKTLKIQILSQINPNKKMKILNLGIYRRKEIKMKEMRI